MVVSWTAAEHSMYQLSSRAAGMLRLVIYGTVVLVNGFQAISGSIVRMANLGLNSGWEPQVSQTLVARFQPLHISPSLQPVGVSPVRKRFPRWKRFPQGFVSIYKVVRVNSSISLHLSISPPCLSFCFFTSLKRQFVSSSVEKRFPQWRATC